MAETYYFKEEEWQAFLTQVSSKYRLLAPKEGLIGLEYSIFRGSDLSKIVYGGARLTQPLKSFFYPLQEKVSPGDPELEGKSIVLDVKACDLRALRVLDEIFLGGDVVDPFYQRRRENTLLISDDCTEPLDSCFCSLLGESPFPEQGFDLNLTHLDRGMLMEVGSQKGKDLLQEFKLALQSAGEKHLEMRQQKREQVIEKLGQINKEFKVPADVTALVEDKYDSPVWEASSEDCVGCCACTNICPSCHCFLIGELPSSPDAAGTAFDKNRSWDSCQSTGFARVAAGANPNRKLGQRFRNRFYCKFEYKPKNFSIVGCTGCGRCIQACQGKIDIRKVLHTLAG